MIEQELIDLLKSYIHEYAKKENICIRELADKKGLNYKTLNAFLNETRVPMFRNYMRFYFTLVENISVDAAEKMIDENFNLFVQSFNEAFDKGYTYLQIEADTGISHSALYKYRKNTVNDISLHHLLVIAPYLHLPLKEIFPVTIKVTN